MPLCTNCFKPYPAARAAMGFTRCIACAPQASTLKASLHYGHKTAGEIDIMSATQYAKHRIVTARPGGKRCNLSRTARHSIGLTQ